jgi:hypothetical protein
MAAYAYSVLKEANPDGSVKYYQPGERIDDLPAERVAHLLETGAAANYDRTKSTGEQVQDAVKESEALKAKVADLEAKLAEATKSQSSGTTAKAASTSSSSSK